MKYIILLLVTIGLIGCSTPKQNTPPENLEIEIHFNGDFNGQKVTCMLNDKTLFKKKLKEAPPHGVAHIENVIIKDPEFNFKFNIDGFTYSYDLSVTRGRYIMILLQDGKFRKTHYDETINKDEIPFWISLLQDKEAPLYE